MSKNFNSKSRVQATEAIKPSSSTMRGSEAGGEDTETIAVGEQRNRVIRGGQITFGIM